MSAVCTINHLDHVGVAVKDIESALAFFSNVFDVPDANVGIIVSGSGSIREHVQRLGRILRARPGKQAMLYELVSQNTGEYFTNQRRRKHRAYEGTAAL